MKGNCISSQIDSDKESPNKTVDTETPGSIVSPSIQEPQTSLNVTNNPSSLDFPTYDIFSNSEYEEYQQNYPTYEQRHSPFNKPSSPSFIPLSQASEEFLRPTLAFPYPEVPDLEAANGVFPTNGASTPTNAELASQTDPPMALEVDPRITGAVYSGIPVWELMVNGIQVMRRCTDSYLNCTQLLKVAGIDKGRRTKILEREVFKTHHEKVQGGYGKYQGTWIPFDEGRIFAQRHGVEDDVLPLLNLNPKLTEIPSKAISKEAALSRKYASATITPHGSSGKTPAGIPRSKSTYTPAVSTPSTPKRQELMSKSLSAPKKRINRSSKPITVKPVVQPIIAEEGSLKVLQTAFMDCENVDAPLDLSGISPSNLDLPLNSEGHTLVHWAATLGMANGLRQLLSRGASPSIKTRDGLTPLMRAVRFTECHKHGKFPEVLDCLASTLTDYDSAGRTVVHHLVMASDFPEFREASLSYLHTLAGYFSNTKSSNPQTSFPFTQLLDIQDKAGDTASHLAARLKISSLVSSLAKYGANFQVANFAGLTPNDHLDENPSKEVPLLESPFHPPIHAPLTSRAPEAAEYIGQLISSIETNHQAQIYEYQKEVFSLRQKLEVATHRITQLQHQLHNAGITNQASDLSPASLSVSADEALLPRSNSASQPILCLSHNQSSSVTSPQSSPR
ncbi:transcriptional regulator swi6 [Entomophthora muscae]|uniref:Transcriptional regulator swi6 n=1 Tax=Entomophthora muscae TaxID=34485 RepID=A0ACC2TDV0_9FUNG|nr:transcriptional regulator swi6 [Entomophthora muscae]